MNAIIFCVYTFITCHYLLLCVYKRNLNKTSSSKIWMSRKDARRLLRVEVEFSVIKCIISLYYAVFPGVSPHSDSDTTSLSLSLSFNSRLFQNQEKIRKRLEIRVLMPSHAFSLSPLFLFLRIVRVDYNDDRMNVWTFWTILDLIAFSLRNKIGGDKFYRKDPSSLAMKTDLLENWWFRNSKWQLKWCNILDIFRDSISSYLTKTMVSSYPEFEMT